MKSSPLPDKCLFKERVPLQLSLQGHPHIKLCRSIPPDCVFIIQCNYLDMQYSLLYYLAFLLDFLFSAQEMDDMARVSEAVTKAVVCALKGAPSDDNTDDWLNPTEVTN